MTVVEQTQQVSGATYDRQAGGAPCECGEPRARVLKTLAWEEARTEHYRVRYHDCQRCGRRFKSLETDPKPAPPQPTPPQPTPEPPAAEWRADPRHPLRRAS